MDLLFSFSDQHYVSSNSDTCIHQQLDSTITAIVIKEMLTKLSWNFVFVSISTPKVGAATTWLISQ